jgi:hypothetical protein
MSRPVTSLNRLIRASVTAINLLAVTTMPVSGIGRIPCRVCGVRFRPLRADALTCTDTCRQRLRRGGEFAYFADLAPDLQQAERALHTKLDKERVVHKVLSAATKRARKAQQLAEGAKPVCPSALIRAMIERYGHKDVAAAVRRALAKRSGRRPDHPEDSRIWLDAYRRMKKGEHAELRPAVIAAAIARGITDQRTQELLYKRIAKMHRAAFVGVKMKPVPDLVELFSKRDLRLPGLYVRTIDMDPAADPYREYSKLTYWLTVLARAEQKEVNATDKIVKKWLEGLDQLDRLDIPRQRARTRRDSLRETITYWSTRVDQRKY